MDFLAGNPYFSAGFGLIGVTAGLAVARQAGIQAYSVLRRKLFITVEIPSKDPSYLWFLQWASQNSTLSSIKHNPMTSKASSTSTSSTSSTNTSGSIFNKLTASLATSNQVSIETSFTKRENGTADASFKLIPAPGRHMLFYKRTYFQIERTREKTMIDLKSGTPWETITVTALARDKSLLMQALTEAQEAALKNEVGKTVVFTSYGPEWRPFGQPRRRRELNSVILADGLSELILEDATAFLKNGAWYHERGIPYRRGYLLHGPPGSGKTSYIQALAGHLGYNICILNLSERGMSDDRLAHLLTNAPPRCFILLEDVDAAFSRTEFMDKPGFNSTLTFSGLLNALDGVAASEERINFMTTNHVERLDPALIRPGRVDLRVLVDNATAEQARRIFLRFYPGEDSLADEFVNKLNSNPAWHVSPATLQGHFVIHRDNPVQAIRQLPDDYPSPSIQSHKQSHKQ